MVQKDGRIWEQNLTHLDKEIIILNILLILFIDQRFMCYFSNDKYQYIIFNRLSKLLQVLCSKI